MKIVKNTAAVSSILSSTISVLVAAVINSPENANKRDKGNVGGREALHRSFPRVIFGPSFCERERGCIYIHIHVLCIQGRTASRKTRFLFSIAFYARSPVNNKYGDGSRRPFSFVRVDRPG